MLLFFYICFCMKHIVSCDLCEMQNASDLGGIKQCALVLVVGSNCCGFG